ncbi:MAG TPA: hypothetical protein VL866_11850 [Pyrinomonadaceae bacterium]|nr:hypothetical protein [Pyrinomonadaceae bacterium]
MKRPRYSRAIFIIIVFGLLGIAVLSSGITETTNAVAARTSFVDINPDMSDILSNTGVGIDPCPDPCLYGGSGGRVNGVDTVPDNPLISFAASELGGLFKTINGGNSWFHLDGHLPTRTWDVAAVPGGQTVYATSFFDGRVDSVAGLQVSKDGGSTWTAPLSPNDASAVPAPPGCDPLRAAQPSAFGIALRPGTTEVLVGTNCGIARSTDGGNHWVRFDPTSNAVLPNSVWDVVALPGGQTYACGDDGLLFSTDGQTWNTPLSPNRPPTAVGGFCSLAVSPEEPNVIFVVFANLDNAGFGELFGAGGSEFYEGRINFGTSSVLWTRLPDAVVPPTYPDDIPTNSPAVNDRKGRVPFVVTNDRASGYDVWVGEGSLWRIPCTTPPDGALTTPRCATQMSAWSGSYSDHLGGQANAHGDSGDLEFDPTVAVDACPTFYSSDGGIYRNEKTTTPGCHGTPIPSSPVGTLPGPGQTRFLPANVGVHAQMLWGMAGVHRPGIADEDIYFGAQDIGAFGTLNAGAPKPTWKQLSGGDEFDVVADETRVVTNFFALLSGGAGFTNMTEAIPATIWSPPGGGMGTVFSFTSPIAQSDDEYWILSRGFAGPPEVPPGLYVTNDLTTFVSTVTANPATLQRGNWEAAANVPCDIKLAEDPTGVQSYVLAGNCNFNSPDQLWTLPPSSDVWQQINAPAGGAGFSMFAVDPNDPRRLYAAVVGNGRPRMFRSETGGATGSDWVLDVELTDLMHGRGAFVAQPQNVNDGVFPLVQPTLIAFDPEDPSIIVAGGRESGVFISSNGGESWAVLTDPFGMSDIPHLPRPFFAHFDHEAGKTRVYIGSVGRGVWKIELANADLSVDKIDSPDPVVAGSNLTYTIQVTNAGPDVALHPVMEDVLPSGTTFQSVQTPAGWSCETPAVGSEGVVRCAAEEMLPGTETFSIVVFVAQPHGTILANLARVVSAALDATPTDNTIIESTNVLVPVAINIRPGGYPNSVNLKSNVTVAILTTSAGEYGLPLAFNATTINPLSVRFGPASVVLGGVGGAPEIHLTGHIEDSYELDENTKDGDLDMVLHFKAAAAGLTPGTTNACVRGTFTRGGTTFLFFGCDSINIVP